MSLLTLPLWKKWTQEDLEYLTQEELEHLYRYMNLNQSVLIERIEYERFFKDKGQREREKLRKERSRNNNRDRQI